MKLGILVIGICYLEKIMCICCDIRDKYFVIGLEDKFCKVWDFIIGKFI